MTGRERSGGDALVEALLSEGVDSVFGLPGIQLDPAVDAIARRSERLDFYSVRHEQAATFMADGYARVTGRPGVAMVVPGPGVLNATAGMATAYACSTPLLTIAGGIPSGLSGLGRGALHEIPDQSGVLRSLSKWHAKAVSAGDIPDLVHEAFRHLRSGRPRPVAIEIPVDVLAGRTDAAVGEPWAVDAIRIDDDALGEVVRRLTAARHPVIVAGAGAVDGSVALTALAERLGAPVVVTRDSRGVIDSRHPLAFDPLALRRLREDADVVLAVGTRLANSASDLLDIGEAELVTIDLEPTDLLTARSAIIARADAAAALGQLAAACGTGRSEWAGRLGEIAAWVEAQLQSIRPQLDYLTAIRDALPVDGVFVTEYTQVGYVGSVAFPVFTPRSYISPGYQGTLGYGFSTALGAQVGSGGRPVVSVNGDGGFSWTLEELSTMRRYGLGCTAIVFHDGFYGNVRRIQRDAFGARYLGTDLTNPDYRMLSAAYGIESARATSPAELGEVLRSAIPSGRPWVIEAVVGEFPSPWGLID